MKKDKIDLTHFVKDNHFELNTYLKHLFMELSNQRRPMNNQMPIKQKKELIS
jgi:hypothetical protein